MSFTVDDAVAGTIPAPDGAVVESQRLEFRDAAGGQNSQRIFLDRSRHDNAKTGDFFTEHFDCGLVDPAASEADPRRIAAYQIRLRSLIHGILKQRDARLVP